MEMVVSNVNMDSGKEVQSTDVAACCENLSSLKLEDDQTLPRELSPEEKEKRGVWEK